MFEKLSLTAIERITKTINSIRVLSVKQKHRKSNLVKTMPEFDLLKKLIEELQICADEYAAEVKVFVDPGSAVVLNLLVSRCEKFRLEIASAIAVPHGNANWQMSRIEFSSKEFSAQKHDEVFARVESRESRLEKLYREVLRGGDWEPELRNLLKLQYGLLRRWHSFVITEESSFIFGREIKIPAELKEV